MAISTYPELIAAIGKWAWRSGVENETEDATFVSAIPDFIRLLESRVNKELRIGEMLQTARIEMMNGQGFMPSDYLQFRRMSEVARPSTDLLPGSGGRGFSIANGVLTGSPANIGDITMEYYAALPPLEDWGTNWLLTKAPDVYLYGSLLEAMPFTQEDARAGTWHAYYDKAIEGLRTADVMARYARSGYRLRECTP